ncbi:hypothetical protein ACGFZS_14720 [Streptomyces sp. NPDC048288]|uniref:hypothetical protein n=1 Tax=Streptomyces sp. NPDC048288 TaxID=3365529 RepID=UPI00371CA59E
MNATAAVKRRTVPVASALATTAALLLTACAGGDDSSEGNSKPPSASASPVHTAPNFDFPSDITVTVDRQSTGNATRDAILRDVAYSTQANIEAFTSDNGRTANLDRYFAGQALTYWSQRVATLKKDGLTLTGDYLYYDFKVTDVTNGKTAAARYCEDQGKAYGKEIKTGKVLHTKPSDNDFILYTLQAAKDSRGDWQVTQQHWKRADASCVRG